MKCSKCGKELKKDAKFCPECGTKVKAQSDFQKKVEAETRANEHKKKMADKELARQNKIIKERGLKNNDVYIGFGFGLAAAVIGLWPAGWDAQTQWWYVLMTLGFGIIGYFFTMRANIKNNQYNQRYRVIIHPKLMKAAVYLCALGTLIGTVLLVSKIILILES